LNPKWIPPAWEAQAAPIRTATDKMIFFIVTYKDDTTSKNFTEKK